jgi:hypothetical protein
VVIRRLPVGSGRYTVRLSRNDSSFSAEVTLTSKAGVDSIVFAPALPLGATIQQVTANGRPVSCASQTTGGDVHLGCRLKLDSHLAVDVRHTPGWEVLLPAANLEPGARSSALKLLTQRLAGDTLVLDVEGLAGRTYSLIVKTPRGRRDILIDIPAGGGPVDGYRAAAARVTATP